MKKISIRFACYALAFTIIWIAGEHVLGFNTTNHAVGEITRGIEGFVFYLFVLRSIHLLRKEKGYLAFTQGLQSGCITTLIYSIGAVGIYSLYGEIINPLYKPTLMAFERARLIADAAPQAFIDGKMKIIDLKTGGSVMSYVFLFIITFLGGFVFSTIGALLFQRKPTQTR